MKKKGRQNEDMFDRKKRKAIRNRGRLKASGLDVFAEKGLYDTTIEDITETADLGKGTFYSHFDNKEELFVELLEDSAAKLIGIIKERCDHPSVTTMEEALGALLEAHFHFFKEHYENFALIFQGQGMLNLQKEDDREVLGPILGYIKTIESYLSAYYLRQNIPSSKLRKLACAVAGFVVGYFSFANIGIDDVETDKTMGLFKKAFLGALSAFLKKV